MNCKEFYLQEIFLPYTPSIYSVFYGIMNELGTFLKLLGKSP